MSQVNIPQHTIDPFARYKRNLLATISQKGSTLIPNFSTVCAQVYRSAEFMCTRIKKELGTSGVIEKDGTCRLKGNFTWQVLDGMFEKIILDHVLCAQCGNPETQEVKGKIKCKACGHSRPN